MRTHMNFLGLGALIAIALTGCTAMPETFADSVGGRLVPTSSSNSAGVVGGGGSPVTSTNSGSASALFQTTLGPVGLYGMQLETLGSTGPNYLCPAPAVGYQSALTFASRTDGWAVGKGVEHYSSQRGDWQAEATDLDSAYSSQKFLTDVAFASGSTTVGYAVGTQGTVLQRQPDGSWNHLVIAAVGTKSLGSVKVFSGTDVWVAGETIAHFDGNTWTSYSTSFSGKPISGLAAVGPSDIWASTGDGFYHWDGYAWTLAYAPTAHTAGAPQVVSFGSTVVGLAVEPGVPGGALFKFDGSAWSTVESGVPADVALDTLAIVDSNTAYALADDGSGIQRYQLSTRTWSFYSK